MIFGLRFKKIARIKGGLQRQIQKKTSLETGQVRTSAISSATVPASRKKRRDRATQALHRDHYGNNLLVHIITYGRAITGFRDNNDHDNNGHNTTKSHEKKCQPAKEVIPGSQRGSKILCSGCSGGTLPQVQRHTSYGTTLTLRNGKIDTICH